MHLQNGHLNLVEFLIEKGANVHHEDWHGIFPLGIASQVCLLFFLFLIYFKQEPQLRIVEKIRMVIWRLLNFCLRKAPTSSKRISRIEHLFRLLFMYACINFLLVSFLFFSFLFFSLLCGTFFCRFFFRSKIRNIQ